MRRLLPILLLALLAGCGTNPTQLRAPQAPRVAALKETFKYETYSSIGGVRRIYTLAAGAYPARFEDDDGVYFEGPGQCFQIENILDARTQRGQPQYPPEKYACGVYMPNKSGQPAKVYFYYNKPDSKDLLVYAVQKTEAKNLHFYDVQPKDDSLRRALEVR